MNREILREYRLRLSGSGRKLVKVAVCAAGAVASVAVSAAAAVPADVQSGLDVFGVTHTAITAVAIGVIVTWMGFRFLKRIR